MGQVAVGGNLEDHYFLQKVQLGQGTFGTVWRGVHRQTGQVVAVKQLEKASLPMRGVKRSEVDREIGVMRVLRHENILQLIETFEDSAVIHLVLEYCDGGDFGDKILEKGLGIAEAEVAYWTRQMCAAVAFMHSKWVCHRDIKPDNFLIAARGGVLKLADLGLAIAVQQDELLKDQCGTPAFMAPEQNDQGKDTRPGYSLPCDVWALGIVMYIIMMGGRHPFLDARGNLDFHSLLAGKLDFRDRGGLGKLVPGNLRMSQAARNTCSKMVTAEVDQRITASAALALPWFDIGKTEEVRAKVDAALNAKKPERCGCCLLGRRPQQEVEDISESGLPSQPSTLKAEGSGRSAASSRSSSKGRRRPAAAPKRAATFSGGGGGGGRASAPVSRGPHGRRQVPRGMSSAPLPGQAGRQAHGASDAPPASIWWFSWPTSPATAVEKVVWEYRTKKGQYTAFPAESSEAIEAQYMAYRQGKAPRVGRVISLGRPVRIDFVTMRQRIEGGAPSHDRPLRRRLQE